MLETGKKHITQISAYFLLYTDEPLETVLSQTLSLVSPALTLLTALLFGNATLQQGVSRAMASPPTMKQLKSSHGRRKNSPPHFFLIEKKEGKGFKLGEHLQTVLINQT